MGFSTGLTSLKESLSSVAASFAHPRTLLWVAVKRQTYSNSTSVQRLIRGGCSEQQGMQQCSLISWTQGEADPALPVTNVAVNSSRARCWHPVNTRLHFPLCSYTADLNGPRPTGREMSVLSAEELWLSPALPHTVTVTALTHWPPAGEGFQLGQVLVRTLDNSRH